MRKRSLCVLTVATLALSTALTGCGGSTSAQTQQEETTVETEKGRGNCGCRHNCHRGRN